MENKYSIKFCINISSNLVLIWQRLVHFLLKYLAKFETGCYETDHFLFAKIQNGGHNWQLFYPCQYKMADASLIFDESFWKLGWLKKDDFIFNTRRFQPHVSTYRFAIDLQKSRVIFAAL